MLNQDFKEFLQLLNSEKIEYLLIGGYAVTYYGYVRYTGDIDFWIEKSPQNASKIAAMLRKLGFPATDETERQLNQNDQIIRMGLPPYRIEVLTSISGLEFEACYPNRIVGTIGGVEVNIIALSDLKVNKKASARLKDLNDLKHLK